VLLEYSSVGHSPHTPDMSKSKGTKVVRANALDEEDSGDEGIERQDKAYYDKLDKSYFISRLQMKLQMCICGMCKYASV
jgi:hypothetical protein